MVAGTILMITIDGDGDDSIGDCGGNSGGGSSSSL